MVKCLLSKKEIDVNMKSIFIYLYNTVEKTVLHLAVENSDVEMVKLLLEKQEIDVNLKIYSKNDGEQGEKGDLHIEKSFKKLNFLFDIGTKKKKDEKESEF
ncbi:hypothetical protein M9Y10_026757 [Tritrichomonas musculus]|uniref:Ankyrin repeat protein n=1 Tax=Tritrichomonas musculus TaxID=1915356 RepID=A0ABR2H6H3_9EUKA